MKEYLVWFVIKTISNEYWVWRTQEFMKTMWLWNYWDKEEFKFANLRIKTDKIVLPKIYEYISKKQNCNIWNITILWISPLE